MDRAERYNNEHITLLKAMQGMQAGLWTAMPGKILSFNPLLMTCEVQLTIQSEIKNQVTGQSKWVTIAPLLDCPVIFPGGGGCTLTFTPSPGDECLVVFASRCIDSWWQNGEVSTQFIKRMHDLSDGFVICGPRSMPNVLGSISPNMQLRTDDGETYIEINPNTHAVNIIAPGGVTITGNLTVHGTITSP